MTLVTDEINVKYLESDNGGELGRDDLELSTVRRDKAAIKTQYSRKAPRE